MTPLALPLARAVGEPVERPMLLWRSHAAGSACVRVERVAAVEACPWTVTP